MAGIPFRYDPERAALVVIDVQNDFCSPDGALGRAGNDTAAVVAMVPRLVRLVDDARAAAVPVVFVRTTQDETSATAAWRDRRSIEPDAAAGLGASCRTGSWGAEFYELAPSPGEAVVDKHRYSAFAGTDLHLVLQGLGVRSLLFAGVATEVCVESSLRDGLFAEYYVSLVADCAASYSPAAHEASVAVVRDHFGTVVTSAELLVLWSAVAG